MSAKTECPCGSGEAFSKCCEPRLTGEAPAQTAEQLMRSRYSAYTLKHEAYLLASWHPSTRPAELQLDAEPVKWIGLKVMNTRQGQPGDNEGTVEFIARYKINGKAHRLQENSHFIFDQGQWFYVSAL